MSIWMMKQSETKSNIDIDSIIQEQEPRLKSYINQYVRDKSDAEDVLQDVYYKLLTSLDGKSNPIEQIGAWLYRVTQNTIINRFRKKKESAMPYSYDDEGEELVTEFKEFLFSEEASTPETEYLKSMVWEELDNALLELPKEQRVVFVLTEIDGLSVKEVSKVLETPINTILSRKHYAVTFLRERLKQLYSDIIVG